MEIIANDMPQHGVMIHVPESPGYKDRLFALVEVPPEFEDEALRYSVVVENRSPQHIIRIKLVWRPYPQEGPPLPHYEAARIAIEMARRGDKRAINSFSFSAGAGVSIATVFSNVSRSLIKPGGQCPWSILDGHSFWRTKTVMATSDDASPEERRNQMKARLAESAKWSVDVDGVLFGDGVFAGPDTHMWFDGSEAQVGATRDFIAESNRKLDNGEDVFAYAEQCASISKEQIEALHHKADSHSFELVTLQAAMAKKTTAMNVIARRQYSGEQATVEWIRASAKSQVPLVRR